ncbi:MAG: metalloregulator ArsR/SmtB family transcription factor [Burkholderiales bacterium]|nr:metalloregulator ArsR/SmtB family transcription factor [Burkholderiales bacterium]
MHISIDKHMRTKHADRVFELAADLFSLLSTPTRLRIVCALMEGEKNVTELIDHVAVSQPNMSRHLGTLYRGGVLAKRRTGSQIFYRVEHTQVRSLCQALVERHDRTPDAARAQRCAPNPI